MRGAVLALLLAGSVPALEAQEVATLDRRATVLAGVGNSMGWFGAQGEKYFLGDRLSVFAGLGYTPDVDGNPSGITVAGGLRGFTPASSIADFSSCPYRRSRYSTASCGASTGRVSRPAGSSRPAVGSRS